MEPGKRGVVKGLSVRSGRRLQEVMASVNPDLGYPLYMTLTYPSEWSGDPKQWKIDLDNFRREIFRGPIGKCFYGGIWRLQAQERGAPHYHVLAWSKFQIKSYDRGSGCTYWGLLDWLQGIWYRVVGSGDEKHLRHGVQLETPDNSQSMAKVMLYLTRYLGSDSVDPDSQLFGYPVGRYWGVWHGKKILVNPDEKEITKKGYLTLRRVSRKIRKSHRVKRKKKTQGVVITDENGCRYRVNKETGETSKIRSKKLGMSSAFFRDPEMKKIPWGSATLMESSESYRLLKYVENSSL